MSEGAGDLWDNRRSVNNPHPEGCPNESGGATARLDVGQARRRGEGQYLGAVLPQGIEIIDFYNACEHLKAAFDAAYGENSSQSKAQFEKYRHLLRDEHDGVEKVIRALCHLRDSYAYGLLNNLQGLVLLGLYLLGIAGGVGTAWLMKRTLLRGPTPSFLMELPPYRLPQLGSVAIKLAERLKLFLTRAGTGPHSMPTCISTEQSSMVYSVLKTRVSW